MERGQRFASKPDPFAGSFLFGTNSSPEQQTTSSALNRSSPLNGLSTLTSPSLRRHAPKTGETKSPGVAAEPTTAARSSSTRKPPLSSLLDDNQVNSSSPINDFNRSNNQYTSVRFDERGIQQSQYMFSGADSVPRGRGAVNSSMLSVEDPFLQQQHRTAFGNSNKADDFSFSGQAEPFGSPSYVPASAIKGSRSVANSYAPHGVSSTPHSTVYGNVGTPGTTDNNFAASSPILTLGQFTPAVDRQEASWTCWVIVYGYQVCEVNNDSRILERFQDFGVIERYSPSSGNWIFIKYESSIQAERAAAQNGTFFNSNTVLAVARLNPRTAKYMNLQLNRDGSLTAGEVDVSLPYSADASLGASQNTSLLVQRANRHRIGQETRGKYEVPVSANTDAAVAVSDEDLYLRPHRPKSVCAKVMEYLFSY